MQQKISAHNQDDKQFYDQQKTRSNHVNDLLIFHLI